MYIHDIHVSSTNLINTKALKRMSEHWHGIHNQPADCHTDAIRCVCQLVVWCVMQSESSSQRGWHRWQQQWQHWMHYKIWQTNFTRFCTWLNVWLSGNGGSRKLNQLLICGFWFKLTAYTIQHNSFFPVLRFARRDWLAGHIYTRSLEQMQQLRHSNAINVGWRVSSWQQHFRKELAKFASTPSPTTTRILEHHLCSSGHQAHSYNLSFPNKFNTTAQQRLIVQELTTRRKIMQAFQRWFKRLLISSSFLWQNKNQSYAFILTAICLMSCCVSACCCAEIVTGRT